MSKKSSGGFIAIALISLVAIGAVGFLSNGFQNWNLDDWKDRFILPIPSTSEDPSDTSSDTSSDEEEELHYSLSFNVSTTNTVLLDGDGIKAIGSSDAQLMSYIATEKLYREAPDSIKFGTSSAKGVLSFELPNRERILSVIVEARSYAGDNTTLKINDMEQALTTSKADYEFDYSSLETATVYITSKNLTSSRFFVSSITIIHTGEEISEPAEPVYHRVEAEKYEVVFPETVNSFATYGNLYWSTMGRDDCHLFGSIEFFDEDCLDGDDFYLSFQIYCDGYLTTQATSLYEVAPGEYGRYVISEYQEWDEPVAFTLEPIYEYVLVE
jgi:hypothetical protein